ncbi:UNVERIFIED_CONTAM: hypothetical protein Sindi_1430100 [Sesamum indicum]
MEGLSTVASGVGKPLYPNAITRACTRLDFARVCVMIDVTQKLTKHIIIMTPNEDGGETHVKLTSNTNGSLRNSFLLPQWKWFDDYASVGNRIWLAWDDNLLDVHVLELGEQFIHCRVTNKTLHESIIITIVYGASEVIDRRTLWSTLGTLALQCTDDPWLVGGDFNAVRDLNEVCGISGDIRIAMEDFNTGIQEARLIPMPTQGEWYTWHNYSTTARSLWKRLDRLLINDRWLARFPTSSYHSLLPLTSDHSPLVIYGDSQQHNGGMFQFDNYLAISPDFIPSVQNIWQHEVVGMPMYAVTRKLKALKPVFRQQRRNKGDLTRNVQLAKGYLEEAQALGFLSQDCSETGDEEDSCRLMMNMPPTFTILTGGSEDSSFDIAEDKAPGPDGFSSGFYKAAWPVVGTEITKAVVEECITTTSFSICLNGNPHGFFAGARGRRQGDPLSPYLFVLVMEVLNLGLSQLIEQDMQFTYHWKCEPARIFQLGFADDLLLFCRADTDSVRVLKVGPDQFAEWSGLRLNIQKSHLIISRSALERKEQLLSILGFQEGQLPMRYLGLPLISSRLSISDCQPLLSKIDARIAGWEGMSISYAGRVQIIKYVLLALSLYWASAFVLPKAIIKEVEKRLRTFLWKGISNTGYAKVAWKDVCKPVVEGGQGIKDIEILNRALMTKKLCDVVRCDRTSIWVEWLQLGRLRNKSIWAVDEKGGSWSWRKLMQLHSLIQPMVELHIGDGRTFYLWKDPWHHLGPLISRFPRGPSLLGLDESTKLHVVLDEGQWHWPLITDLECLQITYALPPIHGGEDRIIWRFPEGRPTAQAIYKLIRPPGPKVGWTSLLSGSLKIPRHSFILWMAI